MGQPTGTPESPQPPTEPLIPGCAVTLDDGGLIRIRHNVTGDTLTANSLEHAEICGAILRITAAWARPLEVRFTTGDLS
ncbi:hypothetical protein [Nonomuraea wenchangensis]|uniref:hypothetical protein n=1 Tax=Nonomuraea wenchangensis TaxID=568860 RepID=UPI003322733F